MGIANVLAGRYASAAMVDIWSPERKIITERRCWVAVMAAQARAGVGFAGEDPARVIAAYRAHLDEVDLASIEARERLRRHDVKARLEEFDALAGQEHAHKGLTSRDLTENVEQAQVAASLRLVHAKVIALLVRLAASAVRYADQPITARTHNAAAQVTTLGKRFAGVAEELLLARARLVETVGRHPWHGLKGPVGTAVDLLDLLGGDVARLAALEREVVEEVATSLDDASVLIAEERAADQRPVAVLTSIGQVYPRSLDYEALTCLAQVAAPCANLATSIRLMAGAELVSEGFRLGQVGSSAMPHKMNTRSCERINGLAVVLRGCVAMVSELTGDQWLEGDVSCSVVRRVALPDAFFAIDGLLETTLGVLEGFEAFPAVIEAELRRHLPFLATTKVLMAAVRAGVGRETAHEIIQQHALAAALRSRQSGGVNHLLDDLAEDARLGLSRSELEALMTSPLELTGAARAQTAAIVDQVGSLAQRYPQAAAYQPGEML